MLVPHPSALYSSSTMVHAMRKPEATYVHEALRRSMVLSSAQMDMVALASYRAASGLALLAADSTGVGKGRQLVGFLVNEWLRAGRAGHFLYVSASGTLVADLSRDLQAVGKPLGFLHEPFELGGVTKDKRINKQVKLVYCTYAMLRSAGRAKQLITWLKQAGSTAAVAFDEIHFARSAKSKSCSVVCELQNKLPDCKFAFASGTAASSTRELACMPRLGLFGRGAPYSDHTQLCERFSSNSDAATECVFGCLAAEGGLIARQLSLQGCSFQLEQHELTDQQIVTHEALCAWFVDLNATGAFEEKMPKAQFWATHLKAFKALLVGFRVDKVASDVQAHVEAGGSAVVTLLATGEHAASSDMDDLEFGDDGVVSVKACLRGLLDSVEMDEDVRSDLAQQLLEMKLPASPLDALLHRLRASLGDDAVVEITGRDKHFVLQEGEWTLERRRAPPSSELCSSFQQGRSTVAIVSAAGSVGVSLHDICPVSRPRKLFVSEVPFSAQTTLQQLGRVNRAGQLTTPAFVMYTSNLRAERRFAAVVAKRARALGAAVSADRRSKKEAQSFVGEGIVARAGIRGMRLLASALEMQEAQPWMHGLDTTDSALSQMADTLAWTHAMQDPPLPKRLLGRALGVQMARSNQLTEAFECATEAAEAEQRSADDDGVVSDVVEGEGVRIKTLDCGLVRTSVDVGVPFRSALAEGAASRDEGEEASFFKKAVMARDSSLKDNIVLGVRRGWHIDIVRPNGRRAIKTVEDMSAYTTVDDTDAKELWDVEFERAAKHCIHGDACKCGSGVRDVVSHMLPLGRSALELLRDVHTPISLVRVERRDGSVSACVRITKYAAKCIREKHDKK